VKKVTDMKKDPEHGTVLESNVEKGGNTPQTGASSSLKSSKRMWGNPIDVHLLQLSDVLEVWFSGAHGDVGGGDVKNDVVSALANIPLRCVLLDGMDATHSIL